MIRCMGCMEEFESGDVCPYCGYQIGTPVKEAYYLTPGTILHGQYQVGRVLGYGGFGITYLGWDLQLGRKIAVKEYLPSDCATRVMGATKVEVYQGELADQYQEGLKRFIEEAKKLAKFSEVSEIVDIYDCFMENKTGYIVMEFLDGTTVKDMLKRGKGFAYTTAVDIIKVILRGLIPVHKVGIIHRDIAPDNIFILKDNTIKLTDFGAARYATTHSRSLSVVLKPGYAPEEQYRSRGEQGPWTDVYAAGATLYRMLTGRRPQDSIERLRQDLVKSPRELGIDIPESLDHAVMNAINVRKEDRFQSAEEFLHALESDSVKRIKATPVKKKNSRPKWLIPVAAVILAAGLGIGAMCWYRMGISQAWLTGTQTKLAEDESYMADMTGMSYEEAEAAMQEYGYQLVIAGKNYSTTVAYNRILSQTPKAGAVVKKGAQVQLVMSGGKQEVTMPEVESLEEQQAIELLEGQGLIVADNITYDYNDYMQKGRVYAQSVPSGEKLTPGEKIEISVSLGKLEEETAILTVPDLVGKTKEEADQMLVALKNEQGYTYAYGAISRENSTTVPKDEIISQSLAAGTEVRTSEAISLVISDGPKKVEVPDLIYLTQAEAVSRLEEIGLKAEIRTAYSSSVQKGNVISQKTPQGTVVDEGTEIQIVISQGTEPEKEAVTQQPQQPVQQPAAAPNNPAPSNDDYDYVEEDEDSGSDDNYDYVEE